MPELSFSALGAKSVKHAASPQLALMLQVRERSGQAIHSVLLECQVRIEPAQRRYTDGEADKLFELFGARQRWSQTQHSLLWAISTVLVPAFVGETELELPLACSYDFQLATAKYFHALEDGEVPLLLLFSGTLFYEGAESKLQVARIAWSEECRYRLPVRVYAETVAHYYPNQAPLSLERDVFDRLRRYKLESGSQTWEVAIARLLSLAEAAR